MNDSRRRTVFSFSVFFGLGFAGFFAFNTIRNAPVVDELPAPMRAVLEWNGTIWRSLHKNSRQNDTGVPIRGKRPRVNGDIGIDKELDLKTWKLEIVEDEENPKSRHFNLTLDALKALPRTDSNTQFRCIEGWSENMSFGGVKFSDLMKAFSISNAHRYVGLESTDGEYYVSIEMESMLHDQTLLAYEMNGAPLRIENGAPLRLAIPIKYGIKNIKQIGKIFFSNTRPRDYWAEQGYDWYSGL